MTWTPSGPFAFLSLGDVLLVGPCGFPWTHRRGALNPLLQPTFRSRAPASKTRSPETARRAPWETRRRSASRSSRTGVAAFVREDAGPPRGHPASSGSVLDGTSPASGRVAALAALSRGAVALGQLFRLRDAPSLEPLTPLPRPERSARAPLSVRRSRFPGLHVNAARFRGIEAPSTGEARREHLAGTRPEVRARWPAGAIAARVHRCSRTSTRPSTTRFRWRLRAACASTASADQCFNEHGRGPLEHPVPA